jgi:hypothetical protein
VAFFHEMTTSPGFQAYCRHKEEAALSAARCGLTTIAEESGGADLLSFGNAWTRRLFDGDFHRSAGPASPELPSVSLIVTEEGLPGRRCRTCSTKGSRAWTPTPCWAASARRQRRSVCSCGTRSS